MPKKKCLITAVQKDNKLFFDGRSWKTLPGIGQRRTGLFTDPDGVVWQVQRLFDGYKWIEESRTLKTDD